MTKSIPYIVNQKLHFKTLASSRLLTCLAVSVIWHIVLFVLSSISVYTFGDLITGHGNEAISHGLISYTTLWDGEWYKHIIDKAYGENSDPSSTAFYPLYPLLVKTIHTIGFGVISYSAAGLIINVICTAIAIYALRQIADFFLPNKYAWWLPIAFLVSPAAFFLHMFYTEALFCALGFLAYLAALQKRWLLCCILLAFATAARLPALLFIGLCALEFMRHHNWSVKKILSDRAFIYLLITPFGFLIYSLYLWIVRQDPLAMFHGYGLWSYQKFNINIVETLSNGVNKIIDATGPTITFDNTIVVNFLLPITGLFITLVASIYAFTKLKNIPLAAFGVVSIIFFSLNSNSVSVHRYLLPTLLIYIFITHLATQHAQFRVVFYLYCYVSIMLQSLLLILFTNNVFAG